MFHLFGNFLCIMVTITVSDRVRISVTLGRSILVHDTFGTKGGRFRYMSISVQTMSRLVHANSAYATLVHKQYNFGTQLVHQQYNFGTCLESYDKQRVL